MSKKLILILIQLKKLNEKFVKCLLFYYFYINLIETLKVCGLNSIDLMKIKEIKIFRNYLINIKF